LHAVFLKKNTKGNVVVFELEGRNLIKNRRPGLIRELVGGLDLLLLGLDLLLEALDFGLDELDFDLLRLDFLLQFAVSESLENNPTRKGQR
jgi:hypothetical protein